jgi:hypothetical protein
MKAPIQLHFNELKGVGGDLFNLPPSSLPTEQVGDNLLAPDSPSLKSETSTLLKVKQPPGSKESESE